MKKMLWCMIFFVFTRTVVCRSINTPPPDHEIEWLEEEAPEYEYGDFFEGDMDLNDDQLAQIFGEKNVLEEHKYRWPHAIVPYVLSEDYSAEQKKHILQALDKIERVSCVRFLPRSNETDYVQVEAIDRGCHSQVGRQGGKQTLNLGKAIPGFGCLQTGIIMHEFLHALGFHHMQSVSNRDEYVKINMENIKEGKDKNFKKYNASYVTDFNMEYDFGSIMHYNPFAFSTDKENSPTIEPRNYNPTILELMGQRNKLSDMDIIKINKMYKCEPHKSVAVTNLYSCGCVLLLVLHVLNFSRNHLVDGNI